MEIKIVKFSDGVHDKNLMNVFISACQMFQLLNFVIVLL